MPGSADHLAAAESPDAPAPRLRELAGSPDHSVRVAVARNPNTDRDVLTMLMPDTVATGAEQELTKTLVENPNAPGTLLDAALRALAPLLDGDQDNHLAFDAGVTLCCDERTPETTIELVLEQPEVSREFRKTVARETPREEILQRLATDRSGKVRKYALRRLRGS